MTQQEQQQAVADFEKLIYSESAWKKLQVSRQQANNMRLKFEEGGTSPKTMKRWLDLVELLT